MCTGKYERMFKEIKSQVSLHMLGIPALWKGQGRRIISSRPVCTVQQVCGLHDIHDKTLRKK
jgi:hypothetical protein